jgi:hypothetical protein
MFKTARGFCPRRTKSAGRLLVVARRGEFVSMRRAACTHAVMEEPAYTWRCIARSRVPPSGWYQMAATVPSSRVPRLALLNSARLLPNSVVPGRAVTGAYPPNIRKAF